MICEVSGLPYWCNVCPELDEIEAGGKCPKGVNRHVESNLYKKTKKPKQRTVRTDKSKMV